MHGISMADRIGFKPTRATSPQALSPDSPLHTRYLPQIAEKDPHVPINFTWPSVKEPSWKVDTGTPPSKDFKVRSLKTSQSFSQRWILLPPEDLANSHTHPCSLDLQTSSSRIASHLSGKSTLRKPTSKHIRDLIATMPYNNTAIPPPEEITGAASLPCKFLLSNGSWHMKLTSVVARVKKILHIDEDIIACSNNGAFAITIATARSRTPFPVQCSF